jgi:hypothetical protein
MYYALSHIAATTGMRNALEVLAREGSTTSLEEQLPRWQDLDTFLGIEPARDAAKVYGLLD